MSILDFLGGAAATGQGIIANQIQQEDMLGRQMSLADYTSQLELQKQKALDDLRDERNRKNAAEVTSAADKIGQDRILSKLNSGPVDPLAPPDATQSFLQSDPSQDAGPYTGMQFQGTPGDLSGMAPVQPIGPAQAALAADAAAPRKTYSAADIAGLTPEQLAQIGVPTSRAQRVDDLATAAESLGQLDQAKDYRGQQQVELQRLQAEAMARRAEAMENLRWAAEQRKQESDDKRWENEAAKRERDDRLNDIRERRVEAMIERMGKTGSADPVKAALQFTDGQRKELANESAEIRALMKNDLDNANKQADKDRVRARYQPKLDALEARRREVEGDYEALREKVGLPPRKSKASDAGDLPAGLPPGSVKIGTSGGKPVWQTPDGRKLIEQ